MAMPRPCLRRLPSLLNANSRSAFQNISIQHKMKPHETMRSNFTLHTEF
jgi:hypothetical protein